MDAGLEGYECPLWVISGHWEVRLQCPLLGVKRKSWDGLGMSAYSQKRTFRGPSTHSQNRTLALPEAVEHWSLTTLREKLIKIGAKIVRHGRYISAGCITARG